MRSVLLVLLASLSHAQHKELCPASCVVCSEDAIICHRLTSVIEVPLTTKAVLFTDGNIASLRNRSFSYPSNMTLLGLSNNAIANIEENAFGNLTALRALLLDHNRISTAAILESTFSQLPHLEILQLGNNALQAIKGSWFKDLGSLVTLQLEGNLISRLDSNTFEFSTLSSLETLDLSDNLITYIARDSFANLPRLRSIDLSRNSLTLIPDAFSYLSWLSALNLDINRWNCSCELRELSEFLSSYIEQPDKILYNGKQLVCQSSSNPAVQTILQLTESNCVPPNQNITITVQSSDYRHYVRDMLLTAVFCFSGAVGLTLALLYCICHRLEHNKAQRQRLRGEAGSPSSSVESGKTPRCTFTEDNEVQVLSIVHPGHVPQLMHPNRQGPQDRTVYRQRGASEWARPVAAGAKLARPQQHVAWQSCSLAHSVPGSAGGHQGGDSSRTPVLHSGSRIATGPSEQERLTQREERHRHVSQPALKLSEDFRAQMQYKRQEADTQTTGRRERFTDSSGTTGEWEASYNGDEEHLYKRHSCLPSCPACVPALYNTTHCGLRIGGAHRDFQGRHAAEPTHIHSLPDYLTVNCVHCHTTGEYRREGRGEGSTTERTRNGGAAELWRDKESISKGPAVFRRESPPDTANSPSDPDSGAAGDRMGTPTVRLARVQKSVHFNLRGPDVRLISARKKKGLFEEKREWAVRDLCLKNSPKMKDKRGSNRSPRATPARDQGDGGSHFKKRKHEVQSNGLLKVKINVNPFRRNRVSPGKRPGEEGLLEKEAERDTSKATNSKDTLAFSRRNRKKDKHNEATAVPALSGETRSSETEKRSTKKTKKSQNVSGKQIHHPAPQNEIAPDCPAETTMGPSQPEAAGKERKTSSAEQRPEDGASAELQGTQAPQSEEMENGGDSNRTADHNHSNEETRSLESQNNERAEDRSDENSQRGKCSESEETPPQRGSEPENVNGAKPDAQEKAEEAKGDQSLSATVLEHSADETHESPIPEVQEDSGSQDGQGQAQVQAQLTPPRDQDESHSKDVGVQEQQSVSQDPTPADMNTKDNEASATLTSGRERGPGDVAGSCGTAEETLTPQTQNSQGPRREGNVEPITPLNETAGSSEKLSANPARQTATVLCSSENETPANGDNQSNNNSANTTEGAHSPQAAGPVPATSTVLPPSEVAADGDTRNLPCSSTGIIQEYIPSVEGSPQRKIRLILPEKASSGPQTALEKKIR